MAQTAQSPPAPVQGITSMRDLDGVWRHPQTLHGTDLSIYLPQWVVSGAFRGLMWVEFPGVFE